MQQELAEQAAADRNYTGVDPELPCVDRFIHGTINSLKSQDDEVHAFIRAGLFRSFTARKSAARYVPVDGSAESIWQQLGYPCSAFLSSSSRPNIPVLRPLTSGASTAAPRPARAPHMTHHATAVQVPPLTTNQGHYDDAYHARHAITYEEAMEQDGYVIHSADALIDPDARMLHEVNKLLMNKKTSTTTPATVSPCTQITTGTKRPRARSAERTDRAHFHLLCADATADTCDAAQHAPKRTACGLLEVSPVKRYSVAPPQQSALLNLSTAAPPTTPQQTTRLLQSLCPPTPPEINTIDAAHVTCVRAMGAAIAAASGDSMHSGRFLEQSSSGRFGTLHSTNSPHQPGSRNFSPSNTLHTPPIPEHCSTSLTYRLHASFTTEQQKAACTLPAVTAEMLSAARHSPMSVYRQYAAEWAAALAVDPALENLDQNLLGSILKCFKIISIPPGGVLMAPGQRVKALFVILAGVVEVEALRSGSGLGAQSDGVGQPLPPGSDTTSSQGSLVDTPTKLSKMGTPLHMHGGDDVTGSSWEVGRGCSVGGWCVARGSGSMHAVCVPPLAAAATVALAVSVHELHACMWHWACSKLHESPITAPTFQYLPPAVRAAAQRHVHLMHVPQGTPLCLEGRRPDACIMLVQGVATSCQMHDTAMDTFMRNVSISQSRIAPPKVSKGCDGSVHGGTPSHEEPSRSRCVRVASTSPTRAEGEESHPFSYMHEDAHGALEALHETKAEAKRWQLICDELSCLAAASNENSTLARESAIQHLLGESEPISRSAALAWKAGTFLTSVRERMSLFSGEEKKMKALRRWPTDAQGKVVPSKSSMTVIASSAASSSNTPASTQSQGAWTTQERQGSDLWNILDVHNHHASSAVLRPGSVLGQEALRETNESTSKPTQAPLASPKLKLSASARLDASDACMHTNGSAIQQTTTANATEASVIMLTDGWIAYVDVAGLEVAVKNAPTDVARMLVMRDSARFHGGPQFASSAALAAASSATTPIPRWELPEDLRNIPVVSSFLDAGGDTAPGLQRLQKDAAGVMHVSLSDAAGMQSLQKRSSKILRKYLSKSRRRSNLTGAADTATAQLGAAPDDPYWQKLLSACQLLEQPACTRSSESLRNACNILHDTQFFGSLPWFIREEMLGRASLKHYKAGDSIPLNDGTLRCAISGRFSIFAQRDAPEATHHACASVFATPACIKEEDSRVSRLEGSVRLHTPASADSAIEACIDACVPSMSSSSAPTDPSSRTATPENMQASATPAADANALNAHTSRTMHGDGSIYTPLLQSMTQYESFPAVLVDGQQCTNDMRCATSTSDSNSNAKVMQMPKTVMYKDLRADPPTLLTTETAGPENSESILAMERSWSEMKHAAPVAIASDSTTAALHDTASGITSTTSVVPDVPKAGANMLVMKIAGMGDLLTADLHTANHIAGRGAEHSNTQAVAVAELETYVVELDSSDMAEVLQIGQHAAPSVDAFLSMFGVFRGIHDADTAARFISMCDVWKVPQGQVVLKAGEEPQCVVAVLQGRCAATCSALGVRTASSVAISGTKFTVQTLVAGGVWGMHAVLESRPLWTDLETLESCTLLLIPPHALQLATSTNAKHVLTPSNHNLIRGPPNTVDSKAGGKTAQEKAADAANVTKYPPASAALQRTPVTVQTSAVTTPTTPRTPSTVDTADTRIAVPSVVSSAAGVTAAPPIPPVATHSTKDGSANPHAASAAAGTATVANGSQPGAKTVATPEVSNTADVSDLSAAAAAAESAMREAAVAVHVANVAAGDIPVHAFDPRFAALICEVASSSITAAAAAIRATFLFPATPMRPKTECNNASSSRSQSSMGSVPGHGSLSSRAASPSSSRCHSPTVRTSRSPPRAHSQPRAQTPSTSHPTTVLSSSSPNPSHRPLIAACNTVTKSHSPNHAFASSSTLLDDSESNCILNCHAIAPVRVRRSPKMNTSVSLAGAHVAQQELDEMHELKASAMSTMELAESSHYKELAGRMRGFNTTEQKKQNVSSQLLGTYEEFLPDPDLKTASKNVPEGSETQKVSKFLSKSLADAEKIFQSVKGTVSAQFDGIEVLDDVNGGDALRVNVPVGTAASGTLNSAPADQNDSDTSQTAGDCKFLSRKSATVEASQTDIHDVGVRVYMAEQAPCVQTHDVVPNDYSNYLTNVQKTAKKKKGSAQLVGVASGLRGRKEFDSLSDTEEPEQEQEEPTDANDSLGWAALWKVTKVASMFTQNSDARQASGIRAAAKRATDALKKLAMRPVTMSVIRPSKKASVAPRVSVLQVHSSAAQQSTRGRKKGDSVGGFRVFQKKNFPTRAYNLTMMADRIGATEATHEEHGSEAPNASPRVMEQAKEKGAALPPENAGNMATPEEALQQRLSPKQQASPRVEQSERPATASSKASEVTPRKSLAFKSSKAQHTANDVASLDTERVGKFESQQPGREASGCGLESEDEQSCCTASAQGGADHVDEDDTPLWLRVPPNIQPLLRSSDVLMHTLARMHVDLEVFAAPPLATLSATNTHASDCSTSLMHEPHAFKEPSADVALPGSKHDNPAARLCSKCEPQVVQVPESIGLLLDRETWLRNDLHDPYSVLTGDHNARGHAVQLDGMVNGPPDAPCKRSAVPHQGSSANSIGSNINKSNTVSVNVNRSLEHTQVQEDWKLAAVHGNSVHGKATVQPEGGASIDKQRYMHDQEQRVANGGKLVALRKQAYKCSTDVVVELPKQRLLYRAGAGQLTAGYGVHPKRWSFGQSKAPNGNMSATNPSSAGGTDKACISAPKAAVATKKCGAHEIASGGVGGNVSRSKGNGEAHMSQYNREDPPPLSVDVPDFDSEHGFTHGFYDPDSYTMYIL